MLDNNQEYIVDMTLPEKIVWQHWKNYIANGKEVFWIRACDFQTFLYVSPSFQQVWGVSHLDINWQYIIHPEDRAHVSDCFFLLKSNPVKKETTDLQYRIFVHDQRIKYIHESILPIFNEVGTHCGFVGISRDVTETFIRLEESVKFSQYFQYFAEKVNAVFWARDDSFYRQVYLSAGYEKIWERPREELFANPASWFETVHPDDDFVRNEQIRKISLENRKEGSLEYETRYRILTPSKKIRWIKDTSFPIQDHDGKFIGFAGIAEDITKEVQREQELNDAKQRAEVANQAKSDFLAMVSHELRTPLNAILGMTQIIKRKGLTAEQAEYIDIISQAGESLIALVSDILDFSCLEGGKLTFKETLFDLKQMITQTVNSLQYQLQDKNVKLSLDYPAYLFSLVKGDSNRIRQIIVNLIINAIKFTEIGSIDVIVRGVFSQDGICTYIVSVVDTGIGMSDEKIKKIFEPFNQTDSIYHRRHRGIGLGLAITKQLVEKMNGEIEVVSELGRGSTFTFKLPLRLPTSIDLESDHAKKQIENNLPSVFKGKVLLVEDDLINQKIAKMMLEDLGCDVDIMQNGESVLSNFANLSNYNMIFMDIGLPDMSGFVIAQKIRQEERFVMIPIVAMTAHILERDTQQAFSAGMNDVISKPINYPALIAVLGKYLISAH